jgi:putative hydrolase of the HAD superfamily
MLKAIIMDFDGLIIDTEVIWFDIFAEWFRRNLHHELEMKDFLICVGSSSEDLFCSLEELHGWTIDRDQFDQETRDTFIEKSRLLEPKDGVAEFIQTAKRLGLKLALATSAKRLKPVTHLTRLKLLDYFDRLVTAEDVERIKPYPDLFLKAAEDLGVNRDEVLVVEDSNNGLISGRNAGMRVVVVPNEVTKHSEFEDYYKKVNSLKDIDLEELMKTF